MSVESISSWSCHDINDSPVFAVQRYKPICKISMLQKLSEEVRESDAHAKDCARKAAAQLDPPLQQSYLDAEQYWLQLVRRLASLPGLEGD